jgi:hypothetical protein
MPPSLKSIEDYNRNHALSQLNRAVSVIVWGLGFAAFTAGFFKLSLPYLGTLPDDVGINYAINNAIAQVGLLLLFINTNNVYEYYISKLEYPLLNRALGSTVYLSHLASVFIIFKNPSSWLWCVVGILALRTLVNVQLYLNMMQRESTHPWLHLLKGWIKRSLLALIFVLGYAFLVHILSGFRFYAWAYDIPLQDMSASPTGQALIYSITTILNLIAVYELGTRAFQQVSMNPSFTREEIDTNYEALDKYYASDTTAKSN